MKILFINNLYAPYVIGGAERVLQTLAEGLAARGHAVSVLTTGSEAGLHEDTINGVRIFRAGVRNLYGLAAARTRPPAWKRALWHLIDVYNPLMKRVVLDVLQAVKPDVVNAHNLSSFSVSAWDAIRDAGMPVVQVLHDQYLLCPRSVMFRDNHVCGRQCASCRAMRYFHLGRSNQVNAVVGVSTFVLDHHVQHGYFQASHIERLVIHNAHGNPSALSVPRRQPDGIVRFGFIGNLAQNKGIELLLRVFRQAGRDDWQLHIAGKGHAGYETYLRETYAASNVIFHGFAKPDDFYSGIDILVAPSSCNDSLATVVFEAMSFGVPVIGSRRGGMPEMIEDGVNGLLFDPDVPEELHASMLKMACDLRLQDSASLAARKAARYFLDFDRFLSSYERLFRGLCQARAR